MVSKIFANKKGKFFVAKQIIHCRSDWKTIEPGRHCGFQGMNILSSQALELKKTEQENKSQNDYLLMRGDGEWK